MAIDKRCKRRHVGLNQDAIRLVRGYWVQYSARFITRTTQTCNANAEFLRFRSDRIRLDQLPSCGPPLQTQNRRTQLSRHIKGTGIN